MTEMSELSDKDFKAAMIKMLREQSHLTQMKKKKVLAKKQKFSSMKQKIKGQNGNVRNKKYSN